MELDDNQKVVAKQLIKNYEDRYSQFLNCPTGFGKTYCAVYIAEYLYKKYNLIPFVVCPKTLIPMWETLFKQINIKPLFICSYNKLVNCPFITLKNKRYVATDEWTKNKVFLICDESQSVKNKKAKKHWALFSLISSSSSNKLLNLSASPIDKDEHWVCLYRNLGLALKPYYMKSKGTKVNYHQYALGDLLKEIQKNNPPLHEKIHHKFEMKPRSLKFILGYMWQKYFKNVVCIPITDPVYKDEKGKAYKKVLTNLFATLDEKSQHDFNLAIQNLKDQRVIINDQIVSNVGKQVGLIMETLVKICAAKVLTLVRLAKEKLEHSKNKVILVCPFIESQNRLKECLAAYRPLILNGKTKDREAVISKFNKSNLKHRVIIITNTIGSEGVSLHDTDGRFPRIMYIVPTHHFLNVFQAAGRTYRRGMKSHVEVNIVYSNHGVIESILIHALAKTQIANLVLDNNRMYPGSYPYLIEDCPHKEELEKVLEKEKIKTEEALQLYKLKK